MLAMAGQDIDQFMREMEVVHKKRETERAQDLNARLSMLEQKEGSKSSKTGKPDGDDLEPPGISDNSLAKQQQQSSQHPHNQPMAPMGMPPPLMYRPPVPPPPPMHLRMPPPPPPRMGLRLPPGTVSISIN